MPAPNAWKCAKCRRDSREGGPVALEILGDSESFKKRFSYRCANCNHVGKTTHAAALRQWRIANGLHPYLNKPLGETK